MLKHATFVRMIRIVKMHFRPDAVADFLILFEAKKHRIAAFEGCQHVALWRDKHCPDLFFTHSRWQSPEHLEAYRQSAFFRETWATTKTFFAQAPEAWSVEEMTDNPTSL